MRVLVFETLRLQKRTLFLEQTENGDVGRVLTVGLKHGHAHQGSRDLAIVSVSTIIADRAIGLEAVFVASLKVFEAVARGGVDATRTGIRGDVVGEHDRRGAGNEGVLRLQAFEGAALHAETIGRTFEGALGDKGIAAGGGHEERAVAVANLDVFKFRMHGDGEVGGQRPRGGGPDDDGEWVRWGEALRGGVGDGEGDPDGVRTLGQVFDFGLGQSRLAWDGPIDRLLRAID